jgi:SAM-dependent methyltransferase
MRTPGHRPLAYLGVFLLCAATLALEVVLTRVLSLTMWHHFTYVVIGVALLGFGAAGSWVTMRNVGRPRRAHADGLIGTYTLAAAVSTPLCYLMMTRVFFDPQRIAAEPLHLVSLLLIYGIIFVPFFCAGLAICSAISAYRHNVGAVYFADLLGAGCGALVVPLCIEPLTGPGVIFALGLVLAGAAACFYGSQMIGAASLWGGLRAAICVALVALGALYGLPHARTAMFDPPLAPSKDMAVLQQHKLLEVSRWSPLARIDVSKEMTVPPMMGGVFRAGTPAHPIHAIYQDGAAPTMFLKWDPAPGKMDFLRRSTTGAGFPVLSKRGVAAPNVMAVGVGGGADLRIALAHGSKQVTGVEINAVTLDLLRNQYAEFTGQLARDPKVVLEHAEGRHFARQAAAQGKRFDLIQLSGVDTYTALSSGAYALSESYLYTQEAVADFLGALTPGGLVSYSRFVFPDKPRETLRLAATAVAALEDEGHAAAYRHVFILYGDQLPFHWATLLIGKQPFADDELAALRAFCAENGFTILFDPAASKHTAFDDCLRRTPSTRAEFFDLYPYDVAPSRDERPFFFNFFKWSQMWRAGEYGGHPYRDTYPVGLLLLLVAMAQTVLLGALFILRPLGSFARGLGDGTTLGALVYFSALGLGFIALEIALMQKLVLFLGHPTYALTLVLPTMLIAAGLGALTVTPRSDAKRRLSALSFIAPLLIVLTWWLVTFGIEGALSSGFVVRCAIAVGTLAPVAFVLGMAFPSAIRLIDQQRPELVPWAWAVNGFTSVLGSTGAVVLAMQTGFSTVMLAVAVIYAIGFFVLRVSFARAGEHPAADIVQLDEPENA